MKGEKKIQFLFGTGLIIFLGIVIVTGLFFLKEPPAETSQIKEREEKTDSAPKEGEKDTEKKADLKRLIFVIDDAGNNLYTLEPFLEFPGPLTIAVLPGLPYSVEAARRIRAAGKEPILHQPMEALGGPPPGPGAIYTGMKAEEIRQILEHNLTEIGPVSGMNNHQGSKVTMDLEAMETILKVCREQQVYFLDSRTTAESAAKRAADRLGMRIAERDVFLDNIQDREALLDSLREGLAKADQQGIAIMIGHTRSSELAPILKESYIELKSQGYTFSTLAELREAELREAELGEAEK
ncbi:MAG: divergent polysaccharide deacetylase family protein [Spirochaetaceae bacterium]|jgi:polysaccharide deacetylase 2 family uncharacterized protein YibQ|nr:divergent polysaccharide deacetylase family protein [Spirochaetaceae bacterium]